MDFGQRIRSALSALRSSVSAPVGADGLATGVTDAPRAGIADSAPSADAAPVVSGAGKPGWGWRGWAIAGALALVPLYYIAGSMLTHRINDQLDWKAPAPGTGGSNTVAVIAGLIHREVDETAWAPNTQGFQPAWLLRYGGNMVNYQSGLVKALSTIVLELEGRVARMRGTGAADVDMGAARQGLSRQPDQWLLNPLPTSSADQEYRKAREALLKFNARLSGGQAVFDTRPDNLQGVLDRIALEVGSLSDGLERQVDAGRRVLIDRRADKVFYYSKGQAYAYFIVLRAMRDDFRDTIQTRQVGRIYDAMLEDLAVAADMHPPIVQNASKSAMLMPNHLSTQGFYLLRARAKMREITDILNR